MHRSTLIALLAVLFVASPPDAEAKGRRGRGSSHASEAPTATTSARGTTVHLRRGSSTSGSSTSGSSTTGGTQGFEPIDGFPPRGTTGAGLDPEEAARRNALLDAQSRSDDQRRTAQRVQQARAEADRQSAEKAAAAQRAAEERAAAAQQAAEQDRIRQQAAAVDADVNRIVQRAMADHPVLRTPEGQPYMAQIVERQKVLVARGLYPSVAMVEAVADHASVLTRLGGGSAAQARPVAVPAVLPPTGTENLPPAAVASPACRWATSTQWVCD